MAECTSRMVHTGLCRNCGVSTTELLCNNCRLYRCCEICYRYLPDHLYPTPGVNICNACQHRDENNVGRYCLDRVIGDRTWRGTANDIDVSNFVHQNDITVTFETARNENETIKYYFEMEVEFYHTQQEGDVQHTTARFYIPPMKSDVNELNLSDIATQFMEKVDGFSDQNSGWIISKINYF